MMIRVGVIGCGYWGPNLIRNFTQISRSEVVRVADLSQERLNHMKSLYPSIEVTTDHEEIINDASIDAVAVATPVHTHHKLAKQALAAGKHVFVEKPLTSTSDQARELIDLAGQNGSKLMVGHTFLFTAAVRKMKAIIDSGELGEIYYISSQRLNLGLFQPDINVIWDLAPHDISIITYLLGRQPHTITAVGAPHVNDTIEDVAQMTMQFSGNLLAFLSVSWLDPDKVRRMTVVGSKKMMVYDDVQPTEKIRLYDKGVEGPKHYDSFAEFHYSYKYGDIVIPKIEGKEPINVELNHFLDAIENDTQPLCNGTSGLEVVKILEASQESLRSGNMPVRLGASD
jgi:predicted dehydrogenase